MNWFIANAVDTTNGSKIVTVKSGEDISTISANDALIVGTFSPVEIKTTYVDGGGTKIIELMYEWSNSSQSNAEAKVFPTAGDFIAATAALREATTNTRDNFAVIEAWGTQTGEVTYTGADKAKYIARTMQQMDTDVQSIQDNNQNIIDTSVSDALGNLSSLKPDVEIPFNNGTGIERGYPDRGDVTFSRASGTYNINKSGLLEYIDIDHAALTSKGVSSYRSATNEILHNDDITNPVWNKGTDVIVDGDFDIINGYALDKVSLTGSTSTYTSSNNFSVVSGQYIYASFIFSIDSDCESIVVTFQGGNSAGWQQGAINFDGSLDESTGSAWEFVSLKQLSGSIYRGEVRMLADVDTLAKVAFFAGETNGGVKNGGSLLIHSAQVVPDVINVPYINTTDSASTRSKDLITIPVNNNFPHQGSSFTVIVDCQLPDDGQVHNAFSVPCLSGSILLRRWFSGSVQFYLNNTATGGNVDGDVHRFACVYSGNDIMSLYVDGELVRSDTVTDFPVIDYSSMIKIGENCDSEISNFRIYHKALTSTQIKSLGSAQ